MCRVGILICCSAEARHAYMPVHAASVHGMYMACAICITLSPRAARLVENKLLCKRECLVQRVRVHHHDLLVTVRALAVHLKRQHKEIVLVLVCWCCVLNYSASLEYSLALRSGDVITYGIALYGMADRRGGAGGAVCPAPPHPSSLRVFGEHSLIQPYW